MAYNLKELAQRPERFAGGHRLCAGCGAAPIMRAVLRAIKPEDKAVVTSATGCVEVSTCIYPYVTWRDSFIHSAFENAGATMSGITAAYNFMKKTGKVEENYKFIAFGGDGGTYDIGIQALSGAMERGHQFLYVCYDNGAYMNTGTQRSSATPHFSDTTTSPAGKIIPGKMQAKKDLTMIIANHSVPYVAQTAPVKNFKDLGEKAEKAIYKGGAAFLNVLSTCPRGWRYNTGDMLKMTELAVETCVWPLYEMEDGKLTVNYIPKNKLPVEEFLRPQGRFKHMFKPGNEWMIEQFQSEIDRKWNFLLDFNGKNF